MDRHGELLHRLRTDAAVRRGDWVALDDVSPALRHAMVLSEDRRFWQHSGVDWRAVSAAAWGNLWHQRTRGASTISMQLAGLLDDQLAHTPGGRSLGSKLGQAVAASVLDRRWRKDQILEAWLNSVPLRGEIVGVDAMARTLFGKAPHGLDARESAVAAALVRSPNAAPGVVARRACGVLQAMQVARSAHDCETLDVYVASALARRGWPASEGIAPHVAQRLHAGGSQDAPTLRTTLRADVQRAAVATLAQQLRELRGRQVQDGAVVVLDNATGEVLAWVGSSGPGLSRAAEVDHVLAPRQAGSTLKPFLYAQAIAQRRLTAASLLDDSPAQIGTAAGLYIPQNYDRQFKGPVSVRTALGASLNVPAVRALVLVGPDAFARQLRALGIHLAQGGDYHGYSLALGSAEVRLAELANAYRALANGGRAGPWTLRPGTAPARTAPPVLDPAAAFIVADILADPNARARTFGTDSLLATRFWSAVKTGTSKDMRDNWAVGFSRRYTVGVWVGNTAGGAMHDVSGTSGAAPVWAALMHYLHADPGGTPPGSPAPQPPPGLQAQAVRFEGGLEAPRTEWFLAGTAMAQVAPQSIAAQAVSKRLTGTLDQDSGEGARITAPAPGTIVALDPDIPPQHQRLHFQAQGGAVSALRWRVNGKEFGRGAQARWLPWPGRHRIELATARGQVLDAVQIEVRGARL